MDTTIEVSNEVSNNSVKVCHEDQPETYDNEINQEPATTTNIINQPETCDNEKHHCNNTGNVDMEVTNTQFIYSGWKDKQGPLQTGWGVNN